MPAKGVVRSILIGVLLTFTRICNLNLDIALWLGCIPVVSFDLSLKCQSGTYLVSWCQLFVNLCQ